MRSNSPVLLRRQRHWFTGSSRNAANCFIECEPPCQDTIVEGPTVQVNVRRTAILFNTPMQAVHFATRHRVSCAATAHIGMQRRNDMPVEEQASYLTVDLDLDLEHDVRDAVENLGISTCGFVGIAVDGGVVRLNGFT